MASVFPTFRAAAIFDRATTLKRGAWLATFAAGLAFVMLFAGPVRAQDTTTPAVVAGVAEKVAGGAAAAQPAVQPATPAITPAATADAAKQAADPHRFMFNFDHQPWKAVLEQFARQANLSLTMDSPPPGTFNFIDTTRRYTEIEALDVINRVLYTTKGYLLVKHDNILLLVDTDANEVAPALIPDVPLDDLEQHGDYELVRVIYPVWNMTAEQAGEQVKQLLGPKMKVVTLPQSRQVQVTELVGRQKTIRQIINAGNQPGPGGFRPFPLKYITADAALPVLRQSLGIVKGADVTPDGNPPNTPPSVRLTRSAVGNVLLFQGTPEGSARLDALLKLIDVPDSGLEMARQTEVYSLGTLDGKKTLDVLEEMFRGNPNVSFVEDASTNTLSAVAPPAAQASIKATIEMLQKDARTVEIIPLTRLDPVSAKSIVSNIFGGTGTSETPNPNGVGVDYDAQQRVLIVRGTRSQIAQVRQVLSQLGENSQAESTGSSTRDKIRVLPYSQSAALSAIRQIEQFMPSMGDRIRIVAPPKGIPVRRPYNSLEPLPSAPQNQPAPGARGEQTPGVFQRFDGNGGAAAPKASPAPPTDRETQVAPARAPAVEADEADVAKSEPAPATSGAQVRFVAQQSAADEQPTQPKPAAAQMPPTATKAAEPKKPVLVVPGPNGLVVVSEDLSALDELEQLMTLVAPVTSSTEREFAVFYLQYATAENAAGVLSSLYGGSGAARGGGRGGRGGGNLVDQLTGQLVQQLAGGAGDAISGLLGGGFSSASVDIVPLIDKNAVLVRAKPTDLDSIGQIIEIIDQRSGPIEDQSDPDPKRIQVNNISASDMAAMIQAIYADRIASPGGGQQDIFRQLTGGGGAEQQQQKMTIYADNRNNQLIIRAPSALYEKVAAMVADLDVSNDIPEITKVVPLSQASMANIKIALDPLAAAAQNATNNNQPNNNQNNNQLQQLQQFQQMQALLGNRGGGNRGGGQAAGGRGGGRGGGAGNAGGGGGGNALQGLLGGARGGGGGGAAAGGGRGGGGGGAAAGGGRGGGRGGRGG